MAKIGYARVSSKTQNIERQLNILEEHNVDKIFQDKLSGATTNRPALTDLLNYIRDDDISGDSVIVCTFHNFFTITWYARRWIYLR